MTDRASSNPYAVSLTALERSVHVPREEQVEDKAVLTEPDALCDERMEMERMLRFAGG